MPTRRVVSLATSLIVSFQAVPIICLEAWTPNGLFFDETAGAVAATARAATGATEGGGLAPEPDAAGRSRNMLKQRRQAAMSESEEHGQEGDIVERRLSEGYYHHLGCFEAEYFSDGSMILALTALELTTDMCYERCEGLGSAFFSTQTGEQCWCTSDAHFDYSRNGVGTCDRWCGGNGSTKCGGVTAADVYALEEQAEPTDVPVAVDPLDRLLELHNAARCMHGAKPLEFSSIEAFSARNHASALASDESCGSLALEDASDSELGNKNVYVCGVPMVDPDDCFSATDAMVDFYEGQLGSGEPATFRRSAMRVLWKSTTHLGCAIEACQRGGLAYTILVCLYAPLMDYDSFTGDELSAQLLDDDECGYVSDEG